MLNPNFEAYKRLKSLFLFSHVTNDAELQSDYTNSHQQKTRGIVSNYKKL